MYRSVFAIVVGVASLLPIPAHAGGREPVRSLLEMRQERVVVQSWDLSCGAAALATLLQYQHGDEISEREIAIGLMRRDAYTANPLLVRIRQGFSLLDLKRFVDDRGYRGVGLGQLTFHDLVTRTPIMVPIDLFGYKHFVVFRGMRGNRVLLADPAWGTRTMTRERFERVWMEYPDLGRVGFMVQRRDGYEPPNALKARLRDFVMLN